MKSIALLFLWKDKEANPPILIYPSSELGKMLPDDIKIINITILSEKEKIVMNFDDKDIENEELIKNIFTASWECIYNAGLLRD